MEKDLIQNYIKKAKGELYARNPYKWFFFFEYS